MLISLSFFSSSLLISYRHRKDAPVDADDDFTRERRLSAADATAFSKATLYPFTTSSVSAPTPVRIGQFT